MNVACPQCGAPVAVLTETRFLRCPFCTSSFTVQEGRGILEYRFAHERDDRLAWSALVAAVEQHADDQAVTRDGCSFEQLPFWLVTLPAGEQRLVQARKHPWGALPAVSLPGGDLLFVTAEDQLPSPDIPLAAAGGGSVRLVYLPLYFLTYHQGSVPARAVVCGVDGRHYALTQLAPRQTTVPTLHVALIAGLALALLAEALLIRGVPVRAAAFAVTLGLCYPAFAAVLQREG